MIAIKKSTLRKAGFGFAALLLLTLFAIGLSPGEVSFADGATCGDGVCDPTTENSDLCNADCECVDNGVADPGEGFNCKDVVSDSELLSSACGTPALTTDEDGNYNCPSGIATDGTIKTLAEFNGVCWDACECEGKCTEEAETKGSVDNSACETFLTCNVGFVACNSTNCDVEGAEISRLSAECDAFATGLISGPDAPTTYVDYTCAFFLAVKSD